MYKHCIDFQTGLIFHRTAPSNRMDKSIWKHRKQLFYGKKRTFKNRFIVSKELDSQTVSVDFLKQNINKFIKTLLIY